MIASTIDDVPSMKYASFPFTEYNLGLILQVSLRQRAVDWSPQLKITCKRTEIFQFQVLGSRNRYACRLMRKIEIFHNETKEYF